jgi:hypothetical protein
MDCIVFGRRREEVKGEWRKPHEVNDLFSPDIVRVIKLRRVSGAGHVARMGRGNAYTWFCLGNLKESDHLEDGGGEGRIIVRFIFRKWVVGAWTG